MKLVFQSKSLDQYLEAKQILDSSNIAYKDKAKSSENVIDFLSKLMVHSQASLGMRNEHEQIYELYVEEAQAEEAKKLISM